MLTCGDLFADMADDDDGYHQLVRTLRRLKIVKPLPMIMPSPRPRGRPPRYRPRTPTLRSVQDRPRVHLPSLEHVLYRPGEVRWLAQCRRCGVTWRGRVSNVRQPAAVLATLAVMRVPCPVCWARAWASTDQATRAAWAAIDAWLIPRWR